MSSYSLSNSKWSTTSAADDLYYYNKSGYPILIGYDTNTSNQEKIIKMEKEICQLTKDKELVLKKEFQEEVKKFLTDKLKAEIEKQTSILTREVETLKTEKNQLKKSISKLNKTLTKTKKEVEEESIKIKKIFEEEKKEVDMMLKDYKDYIRRYLIMDL
jgi:hypothetical protein